MPSATLRTKRPSRTAEPSTCDSTSLTGAALFTATITMANTQTSAP
jgi:hypothetical protein